MDNLILGRPSESLVQDHLNFGCVTTIRAEAELAEGIAPFAVNGRRTFTDSDQSGHPYIRPQTLPQGTVTAAGRGHAMRAIARKR